MNHSQKEKQKSTAKVRTRPFGAVIASTVLILSLVAAVQLTNSNVAYAQTGERRAVSETIPISEVVDTSFCDGEEIQISGNAHVVGRFFEDESGEWKLIGHVNFQGVKGEGLTTGDTYTFAYADNRNVNIDFDGTSTDTSVFAAGHLISQGPDQSAPDLLVHAVFHATINSNGELTAFIDNFSAECR